MLDIYYSSASSFSSPGSSTVAQVTFFSRHTLTGVQTPVIIGFLPVRVKVNYPCTELENFVLILLWHSGNYANQRDVRRSKITPWQQRIIFDSLMWVREVAHVFPIWILRCHNKLSINTFNQRINAGVFFTHQPIKWKQNFIKAIFPTTCFLCQKKSLSTIFEGCRSNFKPLEPHLICIAPQKR